VSAHETGRLQNIERLDVHDRYQRRTWLEQSYLTSPWVWSCAPQRCTGKPRPGCDRREVAVRSLDWQHWKTFALSCRQMLVHCMQSAKRPTTHQIRTEFVVAPALEGHRLHHIRADLRRPGGHLEIE